MTDAQKGQATLSPEEMAKQMLAYLTEQATLKGPDAFQAILEEQKERVEVFKREAADATMLNAANDFLQKHAADLAGILPERRTFAVYHKPAEGDQPAKFVATLDGGGRTHFMGTAVPSGRSRAGESIQVTWKAENDAGKAAGTVESYKSGMEVLRALNTKDGKEVIPLPPSGRYSAFVIIPRLGEKRGFSYERVETDGKESAERKQS